MDVLPRCPLPMPHIAALNALAANHHGTRSRTIDRTLRKGKYPPRSKHTPIGKLCRPRRAVGTTQGQPNVTLRRKSLWEISTSCASSASSCASRASRTRSPGRRSGAALCSPTATGRKALTADGRLSSPSGPYPAGRRYYATCSRCGRRVLRLHAPSDAQRFLCRVGWLIGAAASSCTAGRSDREASRSRVRTEALTSTTPRHVWRSDLRFAPADMGTREVHSRAGGAIGRGEGAGDAGAGRSRPDGNIIA